MNRLHDQLPVSIRSGPLAPATPFDAHLVPAIVANADDDAAWREERRGILPPPLRGRAGVGGMRRFHLTAPRSNAAAAVRGPKRVVKTGKTPVLDGKEWRKLVDAIPTETVRDLRERALIATLTCSFLRVGAR